jgi:hypothetical protein
MATHTRSIRLVGELVVAVFDEAARYSSDPEVSSRLATRVIEHVLLTARRLPARGASRAPAVEAATSG